MKKVVLIFQKKDYITTEDSWGCGKKVMEKHNFYGNSNIKKKKM